MNIESINLQAVFFYLGLGSLLLFCIKMFLFSSIGGDAEVFSDFDSIEDTDAAFGFISVSSILAFFSAFGWFGWVCTKSGKLSTPLILVFSFLVGLCFMFGYGYLMYCVKKLEQKTDKTYNSAVDKIGKAYTHFEPNGEGRVEVEVNGTLSIIDAVNTTDRRIESFAQIKVTKAEENKLFIEPLNND